MDQKHPTTTLRRRIAAIAATLVIACQPAVRSDEKIVTTAPDQPTTTARATSFRNARSLALAGEYTAAIAMYEELASTPGQALRAAIERAEVDMQVGDYRAGIERLRKLEQHERSATSRASAFHAVLAALLAEIGEYEEAIERNRRAIDLDETSLRGRLQLAEVYELTGRTDRALEIYRYFDEQMTGEPLPEKAEDLTWLGRGFYRYSVLTRHRDIVRRTRHVLTEVYQEAFEFVDSAYWPARLAAARLLLDKHNLNEARGDFEAVLEQNPNCAAAHVGLGQIALESWDFEGTDERIASALKINPGSVAARLLQVDLKLTERRYEEALQAAHEALETNPNSIDTLARIAAAQTRLRMEEEAKQTIRRIEALNPRPAVLHHVLGTWLSAARQYEEAEAHFRKAIELAPHWAEPRTALGQVYMDTGEEELARQTLEASFALDSFDAKTHNVLELLDSIDRFDRIETDHFIVKFDRTSEGVIAAYMAEALERFYADVCKAYDTRPKKKTIIQVFPDHMGFSVRVTGRPFIATVGACSGRVIAMVAPRGLAPFGRFNWVTVLRHEFAHTVTLEATGNRIPHWMTEGLAVSQEPAPRSWQTKLLLCQAVREDRLFTLQSIDWGFMRPRRPDDRNLAYMQSEWMFEYAVERYGEKIILDFLAAFRENLSQSEAFRKVLGIETEEFDREFRAWATQQVAGWGLPTSRLRSRDEIRKELEADRSNAALWAEFAEALLLEGDVETAETAARRSLEEDEKGEQPRALEVLGRILIGRMLREKDEAARQELIEEANPHLRKLNKLDPENPTAIKYIGFVEQSWSQWEEAISWLTRYRERFPEDPDSYRRLAGIYLLQKKMDEGARELERLFHLVEDEPVVARQIAEIHLSRERPMEAAQWFRRALDIDPYDGSTYVGLGEALFLSRDYRGAERAYQTVCNIWPERAVGYDGLRRVYEATGDRDRSRTFREKAEKAPVKR